MKSVHRGWGRKVDMVKINNTDRMPYTIYGFPLAIQLWIYEAIPEIGSRFSNKICEDIPRILRWTGTRQPQSSTYLDFLEKTHLHIWATLRPNEEEAAQPYYEGLVPLVDEEDRVLDPIAAELVEIQDCP